SSSPCTAPAAPARPRCSACSTARSCRPRARSRCSTTTCRRFASARSPSSAARSASFSRTPSSCPAAPCTRTSPSCCASSARRAGRVAVAAVLLITLSLAALGGFWLVSTNVGQATAHWRDRVRIIVYLKREPPAADVHALMERVQAMPDVGAVRYVSKAEALGTLKQVLGKDASVAEQLPANPV